MTKVERVATGDPSRHVGKRPDSFSQYFQTHHRGKRSIAVNLREPEGRDVIYALLPHVDVVTENFKPGVMDRLGFLLRRAQEAEPHSRLCERERVRSLRRAGGGHFVGVLPTVPRPCC